jgi:hypothetical protein
VGYRALPALLLLILSSGCSRFQHEPFLTLEAKLGAQRVHRIPLTKDWQVQSPANTQFAFRAGDKNTGEVLVGLELLNQSGMGSGAFSPTGISIHPPAGKPHAVSSEQWRSAPRIRDFQGFWNPFEPSSYELGSFSFDEFTMSPDERFYTVRTIVGTTDDALADLDTIHGPVQFDIYRTATREKVISIRGSHRGLIQIPGRWLSDRYFVVPADLNRSALLLCDLDDEDSSAYDVDPDKPELWGITDALFTNSPRRLDGVRDVFLLMIRSAEEFNDAEWRMQGNHTAIVKAGRNPLPQQGVLFMYPTIPHGFFGFGPYTIDHISMVAAGLGEPRRVPVSSPPYVTPAYNFVPKPDPYFPPPPVSRPVAVVPYLSTASAQDYRFIIEDPFKGTPAPELKVLLNFDQREKGACAFTFKIPERRAVLMDDTGQGVAGSMELGGQQRAHNSQCSVSNPRIQRDGAVLTLALRVEPATSFAGRRNVYVKIDGYAGKEYPWLWRATWRVTP